jgi:hypothetical protein
MTGPDDVPDADDSSIDPDALRGQLQRQLTEVAEQKALLDRMQRGRESQTAAFVQNMDVRYAALAEKERLVNQKIDVLDRVIAYLERPTNGAEKP